MERVTLPASRLSLSFDATGLPDAWASFLTWPVLGSEAVFLGGAELLPDGSVPALVALDRRNGAERFRVFVDTVNEAHSSVPVVLPDGRVAVAVYDKDRSLRVFTLSSSGAVDAVDTVGVEDGRALLDEYRIRAFDGGTKLHLMPLFRAGGGYVVSWSYRQVRFYRTELRRPGASRPVWGAPEACMGVAEGVVVGVTSPRSGDECLVAREVETGRELWRRPFASACVAAVSADSVLVVERASIDEAWRARDALAVEAASAVDGDVPDDFFDVWQCAHPLEAASAVVLLEPSSGVELSRVEVPGWVVSAAAGPGVAAVVSTTEAGEVALSCFDSRTGDLRSRRSLPGGAPVAHGSPRPDRLPALVACDGDRALSVEEDDLVCRLVTDGEAAWRVPLGDTPEGERPRAQDRWLSAPSVVAGDGDVFARLPGRVLGFRR